MTSRLTLYTYFRSSASYRVRIALNLKQVAYEAIPVHLGGAQFDSNYRSLNPQSLVPTLRDGERTITQSLAIIEHLEEQYPSPPLLPAEPFRRARARAIANAIACDIHPLNNLRVLEYLKNEFRIDEPARVAWYRHWVELGFAAIETMLGETSSGPYCVGDAPTIADICLVPQVFNAERYSCPLGHFPRIREIVDHCNRLPAFIAAHPSKQPDAV